LRFAEQRAHAGTRPFGEEIEHHEAHKKLQGIGVSSGPARIEDRRKDEIQDGKSQKGLQKRPQIAQNTAMIAQLEISLSQHPDQFFIIFVLFHNY